MKRAKVTRKQEKALDTLHNAWNHVYSRSDLNSEFDALNLLVEAEKHVIYKLENPLRYWGPYMRVNGVTL